MQLIRWNDVERHWDAGRGPSPQATSRVLLIESLSGRIWTSEVQSKEGDAGRMRG